MFFTLFVCVLSVCSARGFLPVSPLTDCPNIPPQNGIKIDQVVGTWRLGYLLIDDNNEFEEDDTCAVVEIMQVNETEIELLLYVDGREDEFTIERYTKEFDVTMLNPAEWILRTSFASLEYIHVTVIGFSRNHLVLTFCVDPFIPENTPTPHTEPDYDMLLRENLSDLFKAQNLNKIFRDVDDPTGRITQRRIRRPSRLLRGRRQTNLDESPKDDLRYEKMFQFLKKSKSLEKLRKHLWTVILVKDNNTSALRFIENASMLMKYGFKITNGQLVSFGSCSLTRK